MGPEKAYADLLLSIAKKETPGRIVSLGKGMRTPNRIEEMHAVNYATDPVGFRSILISHLQSSRSNLWKHEPLTSSHCCWFYNAWAATLYFSTINRDKLTLEEIEHTICMNLALESLMSYPTVGPNQRKHSISVATPSARSHAIKGSADQREIRNRFHSRFMSLQKFRYPKNLESRDWLSLWFLRKVSADRIKAIGDEAIYRLSMRDLIFKRDDVFPRLICSLHVVRYRMQDGSTHHLASFGEPVPIGAPAYWVQANHLTGEEVYGCDPDWPKNFRSDLYPIDMPEIPVVPDSADILLDVTIPAGGDSNGR